MQIPKTTPQPRWRLAEARTIRKWSQQEVAGLIGTSSINISRWERGITRPNPYFRRKLCALFGKSVQELDLGTGVESTTWDRGERIAMGGEAKDVVEGATTQGGATMQGGMTDVGERATTRVAPTMVGSSQAIVPGGVIYDSAIPLTPELSLVGRDEELGRIQQQLCNGDSVALTALNGLPGVGKTAMSIALAHHC